MSQADFVAVEYADTDFWRCDFDTPGPVVGDDGPIYRYTVYTQRGLKLRRTLSVQRIERTLADPRGWTRGAVRFQRVAENADTDVLIAAPDVVDKLCYPLRTEGEVSCCQGRKIAINYNRWKDGVKHWTRSTTHYRQMLINHEFGHRIGKGHSRCPGSGNLAPVMQQQTYGLQGCKCNAWPLDHELIAATR